MTNYDELLCSQPRVIDMVPVAVSQTIKRGDLLVCDVTVAAGAGTSTIGASFSKAAAVAAPGNLYMIAAEDVTTESSAAGEVLAYGAGDYNINAINNLTGDETTNRLVLLQQGIVLHHAQSGVVSLPSED